MSAPKKNRLRILLVEDDPDVALSLLWCMEAFGHCVAVVADGSSAQEAARQSPPDVILCDINLTGDMDGYDVARAVREDPLLRDVVLIACSGYPLGDDLPSVRTAGFHFHVTKPPNPDQLEHLLAAIPPRTL